MLTSDQATQLVRTMEFAASGVYRLDKGERVFFDVSEKDYLDLLAFIEASPLP